jgi:hypothetical protein
MEAGFKAELAGKRAGESSILTTQEKIEPALET